MIDRVKVPTLCSFKAILFVGLQAVSQSHCPLCDGITRYLGWDRVKGTRDGYRQSLAE